MKIMQREMGGKVLVVLRYRYHKHRVSESHHVDVSEERDLEFKIKNQYP